MESFFYSSPYRSLVYLPPFLSYVLVKYWVINIEGLPRLAARLHL